MRVISGKYKGRKLKAREGLAVRPTTDNVKESVFNIIQFDIPGRNVLDLFAGSGQMGIECISRGANSVDFVDADIASVSTVKENLSSCGIVANVFCIDAIKYLTECRKKYDIIFIDPPYDSDLYGKVLEKIELFDILNDGGIIICESRKEYVFDFPFQYLEIGRTYQYGKIKLTMIHK